MTNHDLRASEPMQRNRSIRSGLLVAVSSALATMMAMACGKPASTPGSTLSSANGSTSAPTSSGSAKSFLADPDGCGDATPFECANVCRPTELTPAVAASLCVKADRARTVLELPSTTTQAQLEGLSRVPWVRKLRLKGPGITDLTPVLALENLQSLDLVATGVTSIAPLASLKHLKHLSITTNTSLVDPWPGKPNPNAKQEAAERAAQEEPVAHAHQGVDPEDVDGLVPKSVKTDLDLSPIAKFPELRELHISGLVVSGKTLGSFTQIEVLEIGRTKLDDPAALSTMTALHELLLVKVAVPSYDFLGGLPKLDELEVARARLTDLSFVKKTPKLRRLVISDNPGLTNLAPLKGHANLEVIDIDDTSIADLSPLAGSPKLYFVDAQGAPVKDIKPLSTMPALRVVNLRRTQVKELAPLTKCTALKSVHLPEGVAPAQIEALKKAHPSASFLSY